MVVVAVSHLTPRIRTILYACKEERANVKDTSKIRSGIASSRAAVVSQGPGGGAGHTVRPRCPSCPTLPPPTNWDPLPTTEEAKMALLVFLKP